MERMNPSMAVLLTAIGLQAVVIGGFLYSTRSQKPEAAKPDTAGHIQPAKLDPLKASDVKRVSLTARSAERLDIKTAPVRAQQIVRKRTAEGKVLASPAVTIPTPATPAGAMHLTATAAGVGALVRVPLAGDVDKVAREKPARIVPISAKDAKSAGTGWKAEATQAPHDSDPKEAAKALYYVVEDGGQALAPGQRVQVEYYLADSGKQRLTVPYSAVIYDPRGDAWVYTNSEPLVYVRHRIKVDYIEGDLAVLSDGPPPGTAVVMAGAAQLFGAEIKVGY
jgi:multidrug efflux pump subunit AcrA (membrane-fusion protein)